MSERDGIGTSPEGAGAEPPEGAMAPDADADAAATAEPDAAGSGGAQDDEALGGPREIDVAADIANTRKRAWLIGAGALLVALALAFGVFAMGGGDPDESETLGSGEATRTIEASPSIPATSSYADTSTLDGDRGDGDGEVPGDGQAGQDDLGSWVDAGMVAYRVGDALWVAKQNGNQAKYVMELPEGEYALSPDGSALAVVDLLAPYVLRIVEVDSGSYVDVGPALPEEPSWSPDSAWVAYERQGEQLKMVDRFGEGLRDVAMGTRLRYSSDASMLGWVPAATATHGGADVAGWIASRLEDGRVLAGTTEGTVVSFAWHGTSLYYATQVAPGQDASIRHAELPEPWPEDVQFDLTGERLVAGPHGVGFMVGYASLMVSPDGSMLAYTAAGDDGFSRLYVVPTDGGTPKELSIRRDAYPVRWTSDGEYLLFIEGNAFQGEDTNLMRVRPSGMGREVIVEGAGL